MKSGGNRGANAGSTAALPAVDYLRRPAVGATGSQPPSEEPSRLPALMPSRTEVLLDAAAGKQPEQSGSMGQILRGWLSEEEAQLIIAHDRQRKALDQDHRALKRPPFCWLLSATSSAAKS